MQRIVFVFLDGVGLGPVVDANPLAQPGWSTLERLAGGHAWTKAASPLREARHCWIPLDATLDLPGLPQSGTGQASLFSGINCAEAAGRHFGPYPHSTSKPILTTHNIFRRIQALPLPLDEPVAFANAYPPRFFAHAEQRNRWTVTTFCCRAAGVRIRTEEALMQGEALTADLTGEAWRTRLQRPAPERTPAAAGAQLAAIARPHAFTLQEYYLTDKIGHQQSRPDAEALLTLLDAFFGGLLDTLDPETDTLLITSDHGNLEDLGRKTHTRNPVPLIAYGWAAPHFFEAASLLDVAPAIEAALAATVAP